MKQREKLANEQGREKIAMDCLCHKHARKPQPEDKFYKVVPGFLPSSCHWGVSRGSVDQGSVFCRNPIKMIAQL